MLRIYPRKIVFGDGVSRVQTAGALVFRNGFLEILAAFREHSETYVNDGVIRFGGCETMEKVCRLVVLLTQVIYVAETEESRTGTGLDL